jgi:hypothetical protein
LRHHWPDVVPRAVIATAPPLGAGAAQYSFAYRSALKGIGVPPSALTRNTSFIPAISRLDDEKYTHFPSGDHASSWSGRSSNVRRRRSPVANVRM